MRPYRSFVPFYITVSVLATVFGAANLALLVPLLEVLFVQSEPTQAVSKPEFSLSLDYISNLFDYHFSKVIIEEGKMQALYFVCKVLVASVLLANLFRYLALFIVNNVRTKATYRLHKMLFDHIISLHVGYFSQERKGDLISRFSNDIRSVEESIYSKLKYLVRSPLTFIIYLGLLLHWSWELTLFVFAFLPISGGFITYISKKLKKKSKISQETLGDILSVLEEAISGIKIIRGFNAQNFIIRKFDEYNMRYRTSIIKHENRRDISSPLSEFLGVATICVILIYGGSMVFSGNLPANIFIAYIAVFSQIITPLKDTANLISNVQKGIVSGERIFHLLNTPAAITDHKDAQVLKVFSDKIEIQSLHFAYQEKEVLKNINLTIDKGETVALVGMSGGGKSTLADLIIRFYDPKSGDILIDGTSIKDWTLESLRAQMGIVTQEAVLFNDTIFNNIAFGNENATQEEVEQAAKIANAHEFIIQNENGYQTNIGDRGSKLSGGQRQRISIARAVLKNPPILILDEATSALDSESEQLVQEAIYKLMEGRTAIVIAHRLSTIQHADKIVVINEGQIVEQGKHQELVEKNGSYAKLVEMQMM